MADETRKLLKIFGVSVTDFEDEADKLEASANQLTSESSKAQVAKILDDASELCRELNTRWLDITQHIFARKNRLLACLAEVGGRQQTIDTTAVESARMEAHE